MLALPHRLAELRRADRHRAARRRRPLEPAALQTLGVERDPHPVVPEAFYEVAPTTAEHIKIAGLRIATGGGLLFGGDTNDRFMALDQRTGQMPWKVNLGRRSPASR